jgi:tricorn protease
LAADTPRTGFKQFPVISRTHVAFIYENDLWVARRDGGDAVPLTDAPGMKAGGNFNIPNVLFFEEDGTWLIEGYGLDPDIEVVNNPTKLVAGIEPQLDAAIKQMMYELKIKPFIKARKPAVSRDRRRGVVNPSEK